MCNRHTVVIFLPGNPFLKYYQYRNPNGRLDALNQNRAYLSKKLMLGLKIKELRNRRNLSQPNLAKRVNLPVAQLKAIEMGEKFPLSTEALLRILDVLRPSNASESVHLFRLNRPSAFNVYGVGLGRTGSLSLAGIFGKYRSVHQFMMWETYCKIKQYELGKIEKSDLRDFLIMRDRLGHLEMDSSGHHYAYIDILREAFPKAKFVFLIRDCYSWLDSVLDLLHVEGSRFASPGSFDFDEVKGIIRNAGEFHNSLLPYLPGIFAFWADSNARVLKCLPEERSITLRTYDISNSLPRLAAFIGVPLENLVEKRHHLNQAPKKMGLLRQMDAEMVEKVSRRLCDPLMDRFFPDFSLSQYLAGKRPA